MLSRRGELRLGDKFELHGRQWSAVELLKGARWRAGEPRRMLCISTSSTNLRVGALVARDHPSEPFPNSSRHEEDHDGEQDEERDSAASEIERPG
jgi:hypothetical protein